MDFFIMPAVSLKAEPGQELPAPHEHESIINASVVEVK
jgi:hypothetical protein